MNGNTKTYYSIAETAKITGLSAYSIRQMVKAGKLPFLQTGMKYYINLDKTMELLNRASEQSMRRAEA